MILIEKIIRIDFGTAPFTHSWSFTDPCLSVQSSMIVEENGSNVLYATIQAYDETCIENNSTATLHLEDSATVPCKRDFSITLDNPCDDIEFLYNTGIVRTESLTFNAPITKKNAPYTYEWTYNDLIFDVLEEKDDSIRLKLKEKVYVKGALNESISVKVTDKYGCSSQKDFVFTLSAPTSDEPITFETLCNEDKLITTNTIKIPVSPAFAEIQTCFSEPCTSNITINTTCSTDVKSVVVSGATPGCTIQLLQNGQVQRTVTVNVNGTASFLQLAAGTYQIQSSDCDDCVFDEDIYLCTDNNCKFEEIPIDWSTLNIVVPNGVTWTNYGKGKVEVTFPSTYEGSTQKLTYFVEDINGLRIQEELCINVNACTDNFLIPDSTYFIGCTDCAQRVAQGFIPTDTEVCNDEDIVISLEDRLKNLDVDWTTLQFVAQGNQIFGNNRLAGENDFVATIDRNRNLIISSDDSVFGTSYFEEQIRFRVDNNSGQTAYFNVMVEKEACIDGAIPVDDELCVVAGETLSNYDVVANDLNVGTVTSFVITQFPAAGLGKFTATSKGIINIEATANNSGTYTAKYKVNDSVTEGTITITVYDNETASAQKSYCDADATMLPLYDLLSTTDMSGYWRYVGKKTLQNDEDYTTGTFKVNMGTYASYLPKAKLTDSGNPVINVALDQDPGFHYFSYVVGTSPCVNEMIVEVEVIEKIEVPDAYTHNVCITETSFDLNSITYLESTLGETLPTGGTWANTVPGTLTGTTFNPSANGVGTYTWTYTVPNTGTFNTVCDTIFTLNVVVFAEVYAGADTCLKVCSDGPTEGDPGFACRLAGDIKLEYNGEGTCNICLYDTLNSDPDVIIDTTGSWILTSAPYQTNVPLYINGKVYFLDVYNDEDDNQLASDYTVPGGYNPCIDFSHLDLGDYEFTYQVGTVCKDESKVVVSVFPAPCELQDINATICGTRPPITLYELMLELLPEGETCTPSVYGNWTDISTDSFPASVLELSEDDNGENDRINPELVLPGDAEVGDDITVSVVYRYFTDFTSPAACNQETCDENCLACFKEVTMNLTFSKAAEVGTANNLTTCRGTGACDITIFDRLVGAGTGGDWYYAGCNGLSQTAIDPTCNIGLTIEGVTRTPSRTYSLGDETLSIDFSGATVGFYFFEYVSCNNDGCCVTTPLTIQVVDLLNPGTDTTCDICVDPDTPLCVNLWRTLGGTPYAGGTWENTNASATTATAGCASNVSCGSVTTSTSGGFYDDSGNDGTSASFNTKDQARGTHIFEYTVFDPPAVFEIDKALCPACTNPTATVTVNLDDGTCIGGGRGLSLCDASCPTELFPRLDVCTGDTTDDLKGGTWAYDGCNLVSDSGPDVACTETVTLQYAGGRTPDNPIVDLDGRPNGWYYFTYTLCNPDGGCCSTQQIVIQIVDEQCAGADSTCDVCNADPECIDLFAQLAVGSTCGAVDTGGIWENLDGAPTTGTGCTGNATPINCGEEVSTGAGGFFDNASGTIGSTAATFNSDGVPEGTYRFKYTTTTPQTSYEYNPDECPNCVDAMAVITINVQSPDGPGNPNTGINVCNT